MKGIKTLLGAAAIAALLSVSFGANAQENNNRDENGKIVRGAYETNGFWDNWFIGIGGGVNTVLNPLKFKSDNFGKTGIATDVTVGKWFTPTVGARLGWHGLNDKMKNPEDFMYEKKKFGLNYFHGDFMWNLSNSFSGYKETRFWDIIPFVQAGALRLHNKNDNFSDEERWGFAMGIGFLNDFRLGKHVDFYIELAAAMTPERQYYKKATSGQILFPSATAGLIFNVGKTNFDRHSSVAPTVIPVPFTVDQYNALKDKVAALEKENASLKNKIAALEAEQANFAKRFVEGQNYVFKDGKFIETDASISTPAALYFDIGKAVLTAREQAHLEFFAQNALKDEVQQVIVTGAADSATGSAKYNQTLSQKRADYVKDLLVKKYGVAASKITATGIGGQAKYNTPAKNRIVTVEVK